MNDKIKKSTAILKMCLWDFAPSVILPEGAYYPTVP